MGYLVSNMTKDGLDCYAGAGAVAEETISNIRTVSSFNANSKEGERYTVQLQEAKRIGIKKGLVSATGMGVIMFIMFGSYSLSFWYGSKLIYDGTINASTGKPWTGGNVIATFFAVTTGAYSIGSAGPAWQAFASGRAAAFKIFSVRLENLFYLSLWSILIMIHTDNRQRIQD